MERGRRGWRRGRRNKHCRGLRPPRGFPTAPPQEPMPMLTPCRRLKPAGQRFDFIQRSSGADLLHHGRLIADAEFDALHDSVDVQRANNIAGGGVPRGLLAERRRRWATTSRRSRPIRVSLVRSISGNGTVLPSVTIDRDAAGERELLCRDGNTRARADAVRAGRRRGLESSEQHHLAGGLTWTTSHER